MKALYAADLFCGAGGASTGLTRAAELLGRKLKLAAVNHWARAVETHSKNHPDAAHFCEDLTVMDPRKAVPRGKLDLLIAAPECTHHSVARGGKPVNDQSRASAWCVLRWCTALTVDRILIENVPEFQTWGPIGVTGRSLKSKKGETFKAFVEAIRSLGYRVEWRVLNAADYGGATTRRRLFLQAVRGNRAIRWPGATHEPAPSAGLIDPLPKWRSAREIIDWTLPGNSIFNRDRPLSENTLKRIAAGLRKFGGANAEPFLVLLRRHADARSIDLPVPTLTAGGTHVGLCEPFLTTLNYTGSREHDDRYSRSTDEPLPTVTSQGNRFGVVSPFVMSSSNPNGNGSYVYSPDRPLPTVTSANDLRLVEPFIAKVSHGGGDDRRCKSLDEPLGTVTGSNNFGLIEPFLLSAGGPRVDPRPVSKPANTVLTRDHMGLCEPFLIPYNGTGRPSPVNEPLRTVTGSDRHALVEPGQVAFDIRFRMLQPHELAAAMGFPHGYEITGNRSEQVKQIGNAIEVNQATALGSAMIDV